MSRPELLAALRGATPTAPAGLRLRLASLTQTAGAAPRRRPGRRLWPVLALALAVTAALSAAVLLPGNGQKHGALPPAAASGTAPAYAPVPASGVLRAAAPSLPASAVVLPGPSPTRAQRYGATLRLLLPDGAAVAAAARSAVRVAQALGGYPESVEVSVGARTGSATVVLRVPRSRVTEAIDRLSGLGRVVGERVSISDLQAGVEATGIRIVRLERQLAAALHAPQSAATAKLVAALSARIVGLQRARAATLDAARDATVTLGLSTPAPVHVRPVVRKRGHGPFHQLGVVFRFAGIGAVYLLALGAPLALLGFVGWLVSSRIRRRREERLLSRS